MVALPVCGALSISVDLVPFSQPLDEADGQRTTELLWRLAERFHSAGIGATWVISDLQSLDLMSRLLGSSAAHDMGLWADYRWLGEERGRSRFVNELGRSVQAVHAADLTVSTLALAGIMLDDHLDLLVKQGLMAVRVERGSELPQARRRPGAAGRGALRYGLWQVPVDERLSSGGWLAGLIAAWRICREIDRSVATGRALHLAVDLPALAAGGRRGLAPLDAVLRHAQRRRDEGSLTIGSVSQTIGRRTASRSPTAGRSILRAA